MPDATAQPTRDDTGPAYICLTHRAYGVHLNSNGPCKRGARFRARISSLPTPGARAWEYETLDMKRPPDNRLIVSGLRPTWTDALQAALGWMQCATAAARELRSETIRPMDNDLITFINARLDEDEAAAKAASGATYRGEWHASNKGELSDRTYEEWFLADDCDDTLGEISTLNADNEDVARHIVRHDPARVLHRVEWTRHTLNTIASLAEVQPSFAACLLSELAMEWSNHPAYRQEWTP